MINEPKIQLLYFPGCPNLAGARKALRKALDAGGYQNLDFLEVNIAAPGTPAGLKNYPSPTILIDGKDLDGAVPGAGAACRIYNGMRGIPDIEAISQSLINHAKKKEPT